MKWALLAAAMLIVGQNPAPPMASIEGVVVRIGTNQPIPEARVMANSNPPVGPGGAISATTDSMGRFVLRDLDSGSYRITIVADGFARMQFGQKVPTGLEGQSPENLGTLVTVAAGQKLQGLVVAMTPTGNISGHVRDPNGRPAAEVPVQLLRATYSQDNQKSFTVVGGTRTDDRGEYRLYWLTPGRYYLAFGYTPNSSVRSLFGNIDTQSEYGLMYFPHMPDVNSALQIDVRPDSDLSGIDMVLEHLMISVPVTISVENRAFSSVPTLNRWGISLREDVDNSLLASRLTGVTGSAPTSDGSSQFNNVLPGRFRLKVLATLPPGIYVKEAKYKDKEALNEPFQIEAADPGSVTVLLAMDPGEIEGTVRDASGQLVPGMRSILIPDSHRDRMDLYKGVNADASGHFVIRDVPPGDYKLFAWESIEPYSWYDADVIRQYETMGEPVRVSGVSRTTVDVRVIPLK